MSRTARNARTNYTPLSPAVGALRELLLLSLHDLLVMATEVLNPSPLLRGIDRSTRWVCLDIRRDKSVARAVLNKFLQAAYFTVQKVYTDNEKTLTDHWSVAGEREPAAIHPFGRLCRERAIEHRLISAGAGHLQINGMVERFNGCIAKIRQATRFDSSKDLGQTLLNYREVYNHHIPLKALGHLTPVQALKQWQEKRPEIFVKKVYNHTGLDRCMCTRNFKNHHK